MVIAFFKRSKKGLYEGKRRAYGGSRLKGALRRVCQARENEKIRFNFIGFWDEIEKISRGPEKG